MTESLILSEGSREFDTVAAFWEDVGVARQSATIVKDGFFGVLSKGIFEDGFLHYAGAEDVRQGHRCNTIIVKQLHNPNRSSNWEQRSNPPVRTGNFAAFIEEVEAVAERFELDFVWVEDVANEFLPAKFERIEYRRVDHDPYPDYVKVMTERRIGDG